MNIVEHVSLLYVGVYSGYMPRSGIAGSSDRIMSDFLRNCQTDFHSGCTSLQSHNQWRRVPLSPHPCQHLLSPEQIAGAFWAPPPTSYFLRLPVENLPDGPRGFSTFPSPNTRSGFLLSPTPPHHPIHFPSLHFSWENIEAFLCEIYIRWLGFLPNQK
jgi:hypothetical protein